MKVFSKEAREVIEPIEQIEFPIISSSDSTPVCIGGIGGSGTRLVAAIIRKLGFSLGTNLNQSLDNLDLPLNNLIHKEMDSEQRVKAICDHLTTFENGMQGKPEWGWKIPGSFYWLPYTSVYFPRLKYIHVVRSGLDMAYSRNLNQIRNWGDFFGIPVAEPPTPNQMLDYWIQANEFAHRRATKLLPQRYLVVNFDRLCADASNEIKRIADFLLLPLSEAELNSITGIIDRPASLGRHQGHDISNELDPSLVRVAISLPSRMTDLSSKRL